MWSTNNNGAAPPTLPADLPKDLALAAAGLSPCMLDLPAFMAAFLMLMLALLPQTDGMLSHHCELEMPDTGMFRCNADIHSGNDV
eukprot:2866802-Rhodomonas_salina.2